MVIVRKYEDNDYELADKILYESFEFHKEKVSDSRVYEFVATLDDKVVAYFNLMEEIDIIGNIKIFHIGYVCVDPECRGQGVGRIMMEYAIQYAKDNGAYRIELTSSNYRVAAHNLYSSLGFEKRDSSIFRKEFV